MLVNNAQESQWQITKYCFLKREIVLSVPKNLKQIKNTIFVRYEVIEYVSVESALHGAVAALIKKF